jgi:hypothetical protein
MLGYFARRGVRAVKRGHVPQNRVFLLCVIARLPLHYAAPLSRENESHYQFSTDLPECQRQNARSTTAHALTQKMHKNGIPM